MYSLCEVTYVLKSKSLQEVFHLDSCMKYFVAISNKISEIRR